MKRYLLSILILALLASCGLDKVQPPKSKPLAKNGAYNALQFFNASRAYPNKDIPDKAHYQAFVEANQNFKSNGWDDDIDPWESKGPHNVSGRIISLAIDPNNENTIYAGSASGGLWKSNELGANASWEYVDTGFPVLGVGAISINPDNSNEIYIGTGEVYNSDHTGSDAAIRFTRGSYGIGILKTEDGGITWSKSLDWTYQQKKGINAIVIDPSNPSIVCAATTDGVYKSVDSGNNWEQIYDVPMAMDIVFGADNSDIMVIGAGNFDTDRKGIYRTADGGQNWEKASNITSSFTGKIKLAAQAQNPNILFASIGNTNSGSWLYGSEDAGLTWQLKTTTDYCRYQGWFAHDVDIDPTNADNLIVVGVDLYISNNGGNRIIQKSKDWSGPITREIIDDNPSTNVHLDHHVIIYHPTIPNLAFLGNDAGVFATTNNGNSFVWRGGGLQVSQFYSGFSLSHQDENLGIGGLQDNSTVVYRGTERWDVTYGGDGSHTAIHSEDDRKVYSSSQYGNVVRSNDQGYRWSSLIDFNTNVFIAPYVLCPSEPERMYGAGVYIYKSDNGGAQWSRISEIVDPVLSMAVSPQNADVLYAGTIPIPMPIDVPNVLNRSAIIRSLDGGDTFDYVFDRSLPNRFPNDIVVDPNNESIVYVSFGGFGTGHLYKSVDAGDTWVDISMDLPDVPGNAIAVDPVNSDHIYYGTDIGVFFSVDGGTSWEMWQSGLPTGIIAMDLKIQQSSVGNVSKIWVATHGNGAYARTVVSSIDDVSSTQSILSLNTSIFPNPASDYLHINISKEDLGEVNWSIIDLNGRNVAANKFVQKEGRNQWIIEVRDLPEGPYVLLGQTEKEILKKKILIMH